MTKTVVAMCPWCHETGTHHVIDLRTTISKFIAIQCSNCHVIGGGTVRSEHYEHIDLAIEMARWYFEKGELATLPLCASMPIISQKTMYNYRSVQGFNSIPSSFIEDIALVQTELSEAIQAWRKDVSGDGWYGEELADAVLRLLGICEKYDVDIVKEMDDKYEKNLKRPYMHGTKI